MEMHEENSTKELVDMLKQRDGVEVKYAEPHQDKVKEILIDSGMEELVTEEQ